MITNFAWKTTGLIDYDFILSTFKNEPVTNFLQIDSSDNMPGIIAFGKQYNSKNKFLIKVPSNNIGIFGKTITYHIWDQTQDSLVEEFQAGFDNSDLSYKFLMDSYNFDFNSRIFSRVLDYSKRPEGEWIMNSYEWFPDCAVKYTPYGGPASLSCIIDSSVYSYSEQTMKLSKGNTTTIVRNPALSKAYLLVLGGAVTVNGTVFDDPYMSVINLGTTDNIVVDATDDVVLRLRQK